MPDVYISYAPRDRRRGEGLVEALGREGISATRAPTDPNELKRRLPECAAAIVCWSRAGVRDDGVQRLAAQAFNDGKLIALSLQQAEPAYPFNLVPVVDISRWRVREDAPHELLAQVQAKTGPRTAKTAPAAVAPPKPATQPKPPNLFKPPPPREESPAFGGQQQPMDGPATSENTITLEPASPLTIAALVLMGLMVIALWAGPRAIDFVNRVSTHGRPNATIDAARNALPVVNYGSSTPDDADEDEQTPPQSSPLPEVETPVVNPAPAVQEVSKAPAPAVEPPVSAAPAPTPAALKAPEPAAAKPATKKLPQALPAPAVKPTTPPAVKSAVKPPQAVAASAPSAAAIAADPALQLITGLESCLAAIARQCHHVDPALAAGFVVDAHASPAERRMLTASPFPDRGKITADNLSACHALKSNTSVSLACDSISAHAEPTKPASGSKPAQAPPKPSVKPTPAKPPVSDSSAHIAAPPL